MLGLRTGSMRWASALAQEFAQQAPGAAQQVDQVGLGPREWTGELGLEAAAGRLGVAQPAQALLLALELARARAAQATCPHELQHALELAVVEPDAVRPADIDDHARAAGEVAPLHQLPA